MEWIALVGQSELSPLISFDDLILSKCIGEGSYGKVFIGKFKGENVAVKQYVELTKEDNEKEVAIYSKLKSPYIVTFIGISRTKNLLL